MNDADIVIVGAGAAGIGAGQELARRGVRFVILEASDRIGGRALSDRIGPGIVWDQGCHWFHSADRNPLVAWADRLGVAYLRQERIDASTIWRGGRWTTPEEAQAARAALDAAFAAIYAEGRPGDPAVADVLPQAGPWAGFVRNIVQLMSSDDPEAISAANYAEYQDTEVNWPVTGGYGNLVAAMARDLPVRTGTPVTRIDQRPDGVGVGTADGTLRARAAIVTASTNVLGAGTIAFGPGPARDLLDKVAEAPCGAYEKVAILTDRPLVEQENRLFCSIDDGRGIPVNFQVAADHRLMIAHVGGSQARELAAAGSAALTGAAIDRLADAFGTDVRSRIVATAATAWQTNPWVLGAYSGARPGHHATRLAMIAAETGPIAFAGEAFSRHAQSTAHGAWQSGQEAAARLVGVASRAGRDAARRPRRR